MLQQQTQFETKLFKSSYDHCGSSIEWQICGRFWKILEDSGRFDTQYLMSMEEMKPGMVFPPVAHLHVIQDSPGAVEDALKMLGGGSGDARERRRGMSTW